MDELDVAEQTGGDAHDARLPGGRAELWATPEPVKWARSTQNATSYFFEPSKERIFPRSQD